MPTFWVTVARHFVIAYWALPILFLFVLFQIRLRNVNHCCLNRNVLSALIMLVGNVLPYILNRKIIDLNLIFYFCFERNVLNSLLYWNFNNLLFCIRTFFIHHNLSLNWKLINFFFFFLSKTKLILLWVFRNIDIKFKIKTHLLTIFFIIFHLIFFS